MIDMVSASEISDCFRSEMELAQSVYPFPVGLANICVPGNV